MNLNTSKVETNSLRDYALYSLPPWIGGAGAEDMFEKVFVESHAKSFSKLAIGMSSKGGGVKLEGFDLLRGNGRSSTMLFQPVIDISSPRKMKLALSSCSFFSEIASNNGTILKLRYSQEEFTISEPIEVGGDDLYFLYHDFSEERLRQVLPANHRVFNGQDKDYFEREIRRKDKAMTREDISNEADRLVAERNLENTIELKRLQIMSDFNSDIILWTQDSRKLFDDKLKWLEVGFRDLSQILSDLVLESDLAQIGYDNFFQRLYRLMRYRLILDWDLTAKDRFSAQQSARGQIGGKISKGGGRPSKKTVALLTKVREMKRDGLSDRAIAKQIKVSPTTVGKWLKSV